MSALDVFFISMILWFLGTEFMGFIGKKDD